MAEHHLDKKGILTPFIFECIGIWKLLSSESVLNLLDEYLKHVNNYFVNNQFWAALSIEHFKYKSKTKPN